MAEGFEQTVEQAAHLREHLSKSQKSVEGMDLSFLGIATTMGGIHVLGKIFDAIVFKSTAWKNVQAEITLESMRGHGIGIKRLATAATALAATTELLLKQRQFNQDLIEANASYEHRHRLLKETLITQTQTGISFEKVTDAARALVHYGMDTANTFDDNLRIVAKMEQGLGISANESARLASIVERQLHGSFKRVSDVISDIVDKTALAGEEAAKLATSLSTSMGRLRPGGAGAGLPEVIRLVGRYESALKQVSGSSGAFQQLVDNLTSVRGMVGTGMLGIDPESLQTAKGMQIALDRFGRVGDRMVGNLTGRARFQALEQMSELFGVSSDQANTMLKAIKMARQEQTAGIGLQERWHSQIEATTSGITRIANSLWALLQTALLPVAELIRLVTNLFAGLIEYLLSSKEVVVALSYVLLGSLVVAGIAAANSMASLAKRLWEVAAAGMAGRATYSAAAIKAQRALGLSAADMARSAGTAEAAPVAGRVAAALFTTPVGWITMGVAAGTASILYYAMKQYSEIKALNARIAEQKEMIFTQAQAEHEQRMSYMYSLMRYEGTPEQILDQFRVAATGLAAQAPSWEELQVQLANLQTQFGIDIQKAMTSAVIQKPLTERTQAERDREKALLELTGKTAAGIAEGNKRFVERTTAEAAHEQAIEDEWAKTQFFNLSDFSQSY